MAFLTQHYFKQHVKQPWLANPVVFHIASRMFGWHRVNQFCRKTRHLGIDAFLQAYKEKSKITHHIQNEHLSRIPKTGSLIVIANHPTGIPDGLVILDSLLNVRKDVKIIANQLMHQFDPLAPHTIPVDPYGEESSVVRNASPLKSVFNWLNEGHCIVLFPSGDVSNLNTRLNEIQEQPWHPTAKKILMRYEGNILPWAIKGRNSVAFYRAASLSPLMKSALLLREGLKRKNRPIESLIGKPMQGKKTNDFLLDLETTCRLLGQTAGKLQKFPFQNALWRKTTYAKPAIMEPLADSVPLTQIEAEISTMGEPIVQKGHLQVCTFQGTEAKNVLLEIGRLREKSFREVNEGTGNRIDIDSFDESCTHLVLWDRQTKKVAGGYRMSFGSHQKVDAFLTSSLSAHYQENECITSLFEKSVLLGRAFVVREYQGKTFPLYLLWCAIEQLIKKETSIQFIIGQTSVPSTYREFSKSLLVRFLEKHYRHETFSSLFHPIHAFTPIENVAVSEWIAKSSCHDFKRLDAIVSNLEPNGERIPVLFKRYLDQGAQFLGANVDPAFNHSLDVLLITRVEDLCHGKAN